MKINENVEAPFFSIVLSIYNVEKYLERCINSVLEQSFQDFELILVDDGSLDSSGKICDLYSKKDKRIKVIHKKNEGLGYARNTGLENAKGQYIFFFDSDDYILQALLKDVYEEIMLNNSQAIFYGFDRVDKNEKKVFSMIPTPEKNYYCDKNEIMNDLLANFITKNPYTGKRFNIRISAWNCCLNLNFLRKNSLKFVSEREFISEDIYFYIDMFRYLNYVSILNKSYYCYCQNTGSLTFSYREDRFDRIKKFYIDIQELANKYGYDGQVQLRLYGSFIATTISCLKMEVANFKHTSIKMSLNNIKKICNDTLFLKAINTYPTKYINKNWKFFIYLINKNKIEILFVFLLIQFYFKGI